MRCINCRNLKAVCDIMVVCIQFALYIVSIRVDYVRFISLFIIIINENNLYVPMSVSVVLLEGCNIITVSLMHFVKQLDGLQSAVQDNVFTN